MNFTKVECNGIRGSECPKIIYKNKVKVICKIKNCKFDFEKQEKKIYKWLKKFIKNIDKAHEATKNSKLRFK
jgi:hypothetical protein